MVLMNLRRCLSTLPRATTIIKSAEKLVYNNTLPAHQFIMSGLEDKLENVICVDGGNKQEQNGEQFVTSIGKMANKLKSVGVGPGVQVGLVGLNHLNYLPVKLGVMATGAVPVLFNPTYNVQEYDKLMHIVDCKYMIGHMCSNDNLKKLQALHDFTLLPQIELLDEWAKDESGICPEFTGSVHDTVMMMFSSGTTGLPKAVELTHDNLNSQLASIEISSHMDSIAPDNENPVTVEFLPEFHTYGSIMTHYAAKSGYKRVMLPMFDFDIYLQCIQDYKAHGTTMVPPIMLMLSKLDIKNYDLSSLRLIVVGAAPLAPETEQATQARLLKYNPTMDLRICQGYGCTETSGATMFARLDAPYKAGTVGPVIAGQEIKLVNQEGASCGPYENGEIFIRGPQIMKSYYNNPKANKSTFDGEFLRTGDIAYYDDDKDFFIVDRLKEFIKVKGFQVAPAELEAILITHDDIVDAAVIGIPHERTGEVPKAYIVTPYGVKLTDEDVKEFVASQVSDYKQLGEVEFIKIIPKLPSGKIQRRKLREKHTAKVAAESLEQ